MAEKKKLTKTDFNIILGALMERESDIVYSIEHTEKEDLKKFFEKDLKRVRRTLDRVGDYI